jgi:hypothetical protein
MATDIAVITAAIAFLLVYYAGWRRGFEDNAKINAPLIDAEEKLIAAQEHHIKTLKHLVEVLEGEGPDDDPDDGEEPGVMQENNVVPIHKVA